jgi:gliding motility-associated-like protein
MPVATPASVTKYVVFGTDQNGCINKDTVQISLKTRSDFFVRPDTAVCKGHSANLLAYGADHYVWSPSATLNNALIPNPIATPTATQIYKVLGYEGACLPDSHFVKVTVLPRPIVNAGANQQIVAGDLMYLYGSGNNVIHYQWLPSAGIACDTCPYTSVYPKQSGAYMLVGTNSFGCTDTSTMQVSVLCQAEQVFIPNSFTPNGDGINDVWEIKYLDQYPGSVLEVFTPSGQLIYQNYNYTKPWDGKYKGNIMPAGTYYFVIDPKNGRSKFAGYVTILK